MKRHLDLQEYDFLERVALSISEVGVLQEQIRDLSIRPAPRQPGFYDLQPGSTVGAVDFGELSITIHPKVKIRQLLFLLSYTFDPKRWRDSVVGFQERSSLVEAIIPGFVFQVRRAIRRGLLQGYETRDEALAGVRGRIRFDDQLRRRHGIFPPVEVTYDDFTEDIALNRILKAAIVGLGKLRLRNLRIRRDLAQLDGPFGRVALVEFPGGATPDPTYTHLSEHYRPAVELARWILRATSHDLVAGSLRSRGFLVDMNAIFEDFVVVALREALALNDRSFPQGAAGRRLFLDHAERIKLQPDISWWAGSRCVFVGDVKYKDLTSSVVKHGDLYQLLAYLTAADLDWGLLIYAAGEGGTPGQHRLRQDGRELHVLNLHLDRQPEEILEQILEVAQEIRGIAERRLQCAPARAVG